MILICCLLPINKLVFDNLCLEIIFSCLPLHTLLGTCNRVCKKWNDVIARKKFLQWRKLYYKYKLNQVDDTDDTLELLSPGKVFPENAEDPILWLLHYVESVYENERLRCSGININNIYAKIMQMEFYNLQCTLAK